MIPTSNSIGLLVASLDAVFLFLSAIALLIRLKSRRLQGQSLVLNDYLALLAWPLTGALVSTAVTAVAQGAGQHVEEVRPANIPEMLKARRHRSSRPPDETLTSVKGYIAAEITWIAANTAIKFSILHFYLTLFRPSRVFRLATFSAMGLVMLFGLSVILLSFLNCRPFVKTWKPMLPGSCGSVRLNVMFTSLVNVLVDLCIIVLPIPMVWRLQMARWRKVALTFTFSLGLIVCVITIIRFALSCNLSTEDFTYDLGRIAIVTDLEPLLGIIVACAPLFPPSIKAALKRSRKPSDPSGYSSGFTKLNNSKGTSKHKLGSSDDTFPLADLEGVSNETKITSPGSQPNSLYGNSTAERERGGFDDSSITVKRGFELKTSSAV